MSNSNPKIFKKLIKEHYNDLLLPAFVHQALYFYSNAVLEEMSSEDTDKTIINIAAWKATATRIKKLLEKLDEEYA